nr:hypothetical protein [uncultured Cohaesibacter sp.]
MIKPSSPFLALSSTHLRMFDLQRTEFPLFVPRDRQFDPKRLTVNDCDKVRALEEC